MIWRINILFGVIILLLCLYLLPKIVKNKMTVKILTGLAIVVVLIMTNLYLIPYYDAWNFESSIRSEVPMFDLLATKAPDEFNAFIAQAKTDIINREDQKIPNLVIQFTTAEMTKYIQNAANESVYHYIESVESLYSHLINVDPSMVINVEFPNPSVTDMDKLQNEMSGYDKQIRAAKEDIIRSAIENPQPSLTMFDIAKAKNIFSIIQTDLENQYGKDVVATTFNNPYSPFASQNIEAHIILSFYEELLAKGVDATGVCVKYMYQSGNQ